MDLTSDLFAPMISQKYFWLFITFQPESIEKSRQIEVVLKFSETSKVFLPHCVRPGLDSIIIIASDCYILVGMIQIFWQCTYHKI